MSDKNYNYETKCRRCGRFTNWHFSSAELISWTQFSEAMADYIVTPRLHKCDECEKETIQDVVSHSNSDGE